jgi:hypothetical protein
MSLGQEVRAIRCRKEAIDPGLGKDQRDRLDGAARERVLWGGLVDVGDQDVGDPLGVSL